MAETFHYKIGGIGFSQSPVVLGQAIQLSKNINGMVDEVSGDSLGELIESLGETLPTLMAIVLKEEDVSLQDKNIDLLTDFLRNNATIEETEQVLTDFFTCNPIALTLEKIEKMTGIVGEITSKLMLKFYSTMFASPLQEETLPNETASCGGTPPLK